VNRLFPHGQASANTAFTGSPCPSNSKSGGGSIGVQVSPSSTRGGWLL
jgi:hypothetical protein